MKILAICFALGTSFMLSGCGALVAGAAGGAVAGAVIKHNEPPPSPYPNYVK